MKCPEFEERMNLLLDERRPLEGDAPLAAHATECEPCRQILAGQQAVLAGLRFGRAGRLHPEFARRVVAQAKREPVEVVVLTDRGPSRRAWAVVIGLVGLAAAMLVAVSIAAFNSAGHATAVAERDSGKQSQPLIAKGPRPNSAVAVTKPREHKRTGNRARQSGTLSLFGQPPGAYRVAIADMASTLPDAVERLDEVERYAPGIRPIRVSFSMLIDAVWRAIPGMTSDDPADESTWWSAEQSGGLV